MATTLQECRFGIFKKVFFVKVSAAFFTNSLQIVLCHKPSGRSVVSQGGCKKKTTLCCIMGNVGV